MVRVKICGITTLDDALAAAAAGADAVGFVFHPPSPRNITPDQASAIISQLPPFIQTVGLFVNQPADMVNSTADRCGLDIIQLHGDEPPEYCRSITRRVVKAFRVRDEQSLAGLDSYPVAACLLDAWSPAAPGGTGETFNWELAHRAVQNGRRIILAGGLTPANVADAVQQVRPYAVDVSSGVESAPGKKDTALIRAFIASAKESR